MRACKTAYFDQSLKCIKISFGQSKCLSGFTEEDIEHFPQIGPQYMLNVELSCDDTIFNF